MAKIGRILNWVAITFAAVIFVLVVINLFDETLKPDAIAFADFSNDEVPPEQNGFFAWVGLRVPVGEDAHAQGRKIVSQVNQKLDTLPRETLIDNDIFLGPKALKFNADAAKLCGRDATGCLDFYRAKIADIEAQVRENKVLLERYRALYRYPNFRETIKSRYYAPIFTDPAGVAGLARAQHALLAIQGKPMEALHQLRDDTEFWRRILAESRSLINKMIAVAAIHRNVQLSSEIIAHYPLNRDAITLVTEAMRPLSNRERDLTNVFRNEFAFTKHIFATLPEDIYAECAPESYPYCTVKAFVNNFFLKPSASTNQSFEIFNMLAATSKLPAPEFLKKIKRQQASSQASGGGMFSWRFVYNPIGNILNTIAVPNYPQYAARMHNLDGRLRLVSLSLAAKGQAVPDTDMPAFLAAAQAKFRNPYTNEPMLWDVKNRAIYFNGMNEKYGSEEHEGEPLDKRIEVRL